jgi:Skp family chaperone for outer membrane proteins
VKRKVGFIAGFLALGVAAYVASRLWADPGSAVHGREKQLKIAVLNLPLVIKKYKKYDVYEADLKAYVEKQQTIETRYRNEMAKLQKDYTEGDPTSTKHDSLEQQIKEKKREMEDLGTNFKKEFSKRQEQQLVTLYREVEDMVKRVAEANNFSLVLQYGDVIDKDKDGYNPRIIQHKVLGGVCVPMYAADGIDISAAVARYLNNAYAAKTGH